MTKVLDLINILEAWAPPCLACDWDPVGLQVGSRNMKVSNIGLALDVDRQTLAVAKQKKIHLIISQHPLIFKHFSSIDYDHPRQAVLAEVIRSRMSVYSGHTAFDACAEGTNTQLARYLAIDLATIRPLITTYCEPLCKVVTFVAHTHVDRVRAAMGNAGAGHVGNYSHCSFSTSGLGTFMPLKGAHPFIGSTGTLEKVEETRIEIVVPKLRLAPVLAAMKAAHPYEEVAHDVYPMDVVIKKWGVGFVGEFLDDKRDVAVQRLYGDLQKKFSRGIWKGAPLGRRKIKRVAVLGGSGGSEVLAAIRAKADLYITGDITHHHDLLARDGGLPILDIGHTFGERLMLKALKGHLKREFPKEKIHLL